MRKSRIILTTRLVMITSQATAAGICLWWIETGSPLALGLYGFFGCLLVTIAFIVLPSSEKPTDS